MTAVLPVCTEKEQRVVCGLFVVGGVIESGQNLHLSAHCGYNVFSVECVNGLNCPRKVDECDQCRAFKMTIQPHPLMTDWNWQGPQFSAT
jgi:hypothetical protein